MTLLLLQAVRHHHPPTSVSSRQNLTVRHVSLDLEGFNRLFVSGSAAADACARAVCWKDLETCGRDDTRVLLLRPA